MMLTPLFGALSPLGAKASAAAITYLLRDEFTTDAAAPLASPRTCEPGGGTLTITDTANKLSISGGKLVLVGKSSYGDPRVVGAVQTKSNGIAFGFTFTRESYANGNITLSIGWHDNVSQNGHVRTGFVIIYNSILLSQSTDMFTIAPQLLANSSTKFATVIATDRAYQIYKLTGGAWTLLWCSAYTAPALIYPSLNYYAAPTNWVDDLFVANLGGAWATDYGIATNRVASPTSPTATTSTANAIIEFMWTPGAGETLELDVRRTDADNRWVVRCAQAGSTIKLIERNSGSETERSSASQTWSVGTAYRIVVIQDANTIKTYVANTAKNSYTSASFNNTATGINVAGFATGTNLVCYPRDVSQFIPAGL